jgi:hypothetical protein
LDEVSLLVLIFLGLAWCHKQHQWKEAKKTKLEACSQCKPGRQSQRSTQDKNHCNDNAKLSTDGNASDDAARVSNSSDTASPAQDPHNVKPESKGNLEQRAGMERLGTNSAPTLKAMGPQLERVLQKLSADDAAVLKACLYSKDKNLRGMSVQPSPTSTKTPRKIQVSSLRDNLQRLATFESSRVLMVKKINKLGFNSNRVLQQFFSKFGKVEEVLMTHSIDKRSGADKPRYRPAGIGFMVVESSDVAAAILQRPEYSILGVDVIVDKFEHVCPKDAPTEHSDINEDSDQEDCTEFISPAEEHTCCR